MLVSVQKENVIESLQKAAGIIPSRSGSPALRSVWLEAKEKFLTIMATDSSIEFTGICSATVKSEGFVGVNRRNFVDLIRRLSTGDLQIEYTDTTLIVKQGRRTYKLPANDPSWFQKLSDFPAEGSVLGSGDFFQEIIDRVFFCIKDDETLDATSCLYLKPTGDGNIDACGLNGFQFALTKFTHAELAAILPEEGILIQRYYVTELRKWLSGEKIEINITPKQLFIRSSEGKEMLTLPCAGYIYPDCSSFMNRINKPDAAKLIINRKDFLEALDRLSIFNTESNRCTYFDLNQDEMILSSQGQDRGSANEVLEVSYTGNISRIAFPTKNLMEILTHYQSEKLLLTLTGVEGPCSIVGTEDPDYIVLIMPMKINDEDWYYEEE